MAATSWNKFGPDDPLISLPLNVQNCLSPNLPTADCDKIIGNAAAGASSGQFCAQDKYKTMTYCACVNNSIGKCPQFMAACGNSAFSYKPSFWFEADGKTPIDHNGCNEAPFCANIIDISGDKNIISGITQQCGNITYIQSAIKSNPVLAFLVFALLIFMIIVMMNGTTPTEPPIIPPPGLDEI
jgi:hypothetical protein